MKIYVVFHSGEGIPTTIHSAHYSQWMAEITSKNKNQELLDEKNEGIKQYRWKPYTLEDLWEGYSYEATELTSETD